MSGSYYSPEPTPPPVEHPPAHDCDCPDTGGLVGNLLNLDNLLGGSVSVGPGLIDVNLDGETGNTGALLSVVAGGEGLGDLSVELNTDAIGDIGMLGCTAGLLGGLDVLDGIFCDGILT